MIYGCDQLLRISYTTPQGTGIVAGKALPQSPNIGSDSYGVAKDHCNKALVRLEEWKALSSGTDFKL